MTVSAPRQEAGVKGLMTHNGRTSFKVLHSNLTPLPLHFHSTPTPLSLQNFFERSYGVVLHYTLTPLPLHFHSTPTPLSLHNFLKEVVKWSFTPLSLHSHSASALLPLHSHSKTFLKEVVEWSFTPTTSGVRQGCVLAPALFCVAIDWILNHIDANPGIRVSSSSFTDLVYADDTILFATSSQSAVESLSSF